MSSAISGFCLVGGITTCPFPTHPVVLGAVVKAGPEMLNLFRGGGGFCSCNQ